MKTILDKLFAPFDRMVAREEAAAAQNQGMPTLGWIALGGVVVILLFLWFGLKNMQDEQAKAFEAVQRIRQQQ